MLDLKNVISILISSDFLKMKELVQECICYVVSNLHDVVRLPIDMNCLNAGIIAQISEQVPLLKLNYIQDKRDKLQSKLFHVKVEKLLYVSMLNSYTLDLECNRPQIYNQNLHEYLFRNKLHSELLTAVQLVKDNPTENSTCFTVDVF